MPFAPHPFFSYYPNCRKCEEREEIQEEVDGDRQTTLALAKHEDDRPPAAAAAAAAAQDSKSELLEQAFVQNQLLLANIKVKLDDALNKVIISCVTLSMRPNVRLSSVGWLVGRSVCYKFKFHFPCSYWSTCSKYTSASLLHNIDNETFD